jgi:O-methyltransferase
MSPFLAEIARMQEQILLPLFIKISRLQEQFLMNIGAEPTRDIETEFFEVYEKCREYTLTPMKTMYAMYEAAAYVAKAQIPGDFVECGVWKGGSAMIVALTFLRASHLPKPLAL